MNDIKHQGNPEGGPDAPRERADSSTPGKEAPIQPALATAQPMVGREAGAITGKVLTPPNDLYEFVRHFYESKTPVGEKYREFFRNLDDKLTGDQQDDLYQLASANDPEFSSTLSLAEFVLETSGKQNHRDKIMGFVERVASNAGSLGITSSNTMFQDWLENNRAASDKLNIFFNKIERVTDGKDKNGNEKKLAKKTRNNLGSIAAMWLYYKDEATLPQLINHLMRSGMDLRGEAGKPVESRAFAFVASMIKSTNKKKFAYFVDYVGKNESKLTEQARQSNQRVSEQSSRIAALVFQNQEASAALEKEQSNSAELKEMVNVLKQELEALEQKRVHQSVHHGAAIETADSQYSAVLKQLSDLVSLAKTALEREKTHILEYQLDEIEAILCKELE